MDHLNAESWAHHIQVPMLIPEVTGTATVDCSQGWRGYPSRCGRSEMNYVSGLTADFTNSGHDSPSEAAAFLQEWLFFGMISIFCKKPIRLEEFRRPHPDGANARQLVTTSKLPELLNQWSLSLTECSQAQKAAFGTALSQFFQSTYSIYQTCLHYEEDDLRRNSPLPPDVALSIIILHKTLVVAMRLVWKESTYEPRELLYNAPKEFLYSRLDELGWCIHETNRLSETISSIGLYYLFTLGPRSYHRDHRLCSPRAIMEWGLETKHVDDDCSCNLIGYEGSEIADAIRNGHTPLVVYQKDDSRQNGCVKMIFKGPGVDYVALSHIWADGMASEQNNRLPECILSKVQGAVNKLYPEKPSDHNVPFWIDSACVPVEPEFVDARKRGIVNMASIYKDADKVLMWDKDLLFESNKRNMLAKAMTISAAAWSSRLWTLQEGVLARNLHFQFRDEAIPGDFLWRLCELPENAPPGVELLIPAVLREIIWTFKILWKFRNSKPEDRLAYTWNGIAPRHTTKAEDEPVCLSTLLELDPEDSATVVSAAGPERMKEFVRRARRFPSSCIFQLDQNFEERGLRWAPKSLLLSRRPVDAVQDVETRSTGEEPLGDVTPEGIMVKYPGFELTIHEEPHYSEKYLLFHETDSDTWYNMMTIDTDDLRRPWKETFGDAKEVAIIMVRVPHSVRYGDRVVRGLLVSVHGSPATAANGIKYCEPLKDVLVIQEGAGIESRRRRLDQQRVDSTVFTSRTTAVLCHASQKWCVG